MSSLFYDHLIKLHTLDHQIKSLQLTAQELEELHDSIDQLIQHQVIEIILNVLDQNEHHIFIAKFETAPHDPELLHWLATHIENIEILIQNHIRQLESQLLNHLLND